MSYIYSFLVLTQEDTLWKAHLKDMNYVKVYVCVCVCIRLFTHVF